MPLSTRTPSGKVALEKLRHALDATQLHGIATNLDYLRQITASDAFRSGNVWTRYLDSVVPAAVIWRR